MPKYAKLSDIDLEEPVGTKRWQKKHHAGASKVSRLRFAHKTAKKAGAKKPHAWVSGARRSLGRKSSADLTTKEVLTLAGERKPDFQYKLRKGLTKAVRTVYPSFRESCLARQRYELLMEARAVAALRKIATRRRGRSKAAGAVLATKDMWPVVGGYAGLAGTIGGTLAKVGARGADRVRKSVTAAQKSGARSRTFPAARKAREFAGSVWRGGPKHKVRSKTDKIGTLTDVASVF